MNNRRPNVPFAKRSFGQNFLSDQSFISQIIANVAPSDGETIIEIGPGRGALTEPILAANAKVIAIELDRDMISPLRAQFALYPNFSIVEADALDVDFAELSGGQTAKLVANLPYNISTAILQRLADQRAAFSQLTLMFQREVVERITAPAGSSARGFLTVIVEEAFTVTHLFDVPPNAFRPAPKVWSAVVELTPKPSTIADPVAFRYIVSIGFAQKRKTIANNLKHLRPDSADILKSINIDPGRRAETLTFDEWKRLAETFPEH